MEWSCFQIRCECKSPGPVSKNMNKGIEESNLVLTELYFYVLKGCRLDKEAR